MGSPLGALANLADTIVIKDGNVFLVSLRDGRLPADVQHPLGLWFRDCRFLRTLELRICGTLPRLLTATDAAGNCAVHELTNPDLDLVGGQQLPAESLRLRVERIAEAEGALRQRIAVRSYHRHPIEFPLELRLGADFQPMLELRGVVAPRERPRPTSAPRASRSWGATECCAARPFAPHPSHAGSRTARSCSTSPWTRAALPTWSWTSRSPRAATARCRGGSRDAGSRRALA